MQQLQTQGDDDKDAGDVSVDGDRQTAGPAHGVRGRAWDRPFVLKL